MKDTLLIWDKKENYSKKIANGLAITDENILYSTQNIKEKDLAKIQAIVLLLETNIDGENRTRFYGLEIIKILRKDLKYKGLIIPCSFMPLAYFKKQKNNTEVLLTSGVEFKQIGSDNLDKDTLSSHIRDFSPLSDQLLEDLSYYVFDNGGRIRELLHNLKNALRDIKKSDKEELRKSLLNKIDEYADKIKNNVKAGKENKLSSIVEDIKIEIEKGLESLDDSTSEYADAADVINNSSDILENLGSIKEAVTPDDDVNGSEKKPWQVMHLEDDAGTREKVKAFFETKGVTCHSPTSEKEVYKMLEEHKEFISLFITDIRLMHENKKWWNKQGYDFIREIVESNKYPLTYAVLTSKRGYMFDRLKDKQNVSVQWFNKEDVIKNKYAFNIFYEAVATYAEENYRANRIFRVKLWDDQIKITKSKYSFLHIDYYKRYRTHHIYNLKEREINRIAADCLKEYKNRSKELEDKPIFIKEWQTSIKKEDIDDCIEDFTDYILLGRRICLAFIIEEEKLNRDDILELISEPFQSKGKGTDGKHKRLLNTTFRLSTKFEVLRSQIKDFKKETKNHKKGPGILKEEYDFICYELKDLLNKKYTKYFKNTIEIICNKYIKTCKKSNIKNSQIPIEFSNLKYIEDTEILTYKGEIEKGFNKILELDCNDDSGNYTAILKNSSALKDLVDYNKNQLTKSARDYIKQILKEIFNIDFG